MAAIMKMPLRELDPLLSSIISKEANRQRESVVLIPSENFTSRSVMEAQCSVLQNKYSEGYPGARYYGGNEFIDQSEKLCQQRALDAFGLDSAEWGVNVQSLSGSPANLAVLSAILKPHERFMGLDLPHGGHLSHGYQTASKKISATSAYFESFPYRCDESTGLIDYLSLQKNASIYRPKLIIAGGSAYPRHIDYENIRKTCDSVNAFLMVDMAHISGLIAAGVMPSPFKHAHIVTTTTHKSLRGPRAALIFYKLKHNVKSNIESLKEAIDFSVFPGHQGGPHNHTISGLSVALLQATMTEFKEYQAMVLKNNAAMTNHFIQRGLSLLTGGSDNHLSVIDLRNQGIDGARVEKLLEICNIATNKNTIPGDNNAIIPKGLRLGSPAMTTRGCDENDFVEIADMVISGIDIAKKLNNHLKQLSDPTPSKLVDFKSALETKSTPGCDELFNEISKLKTRVVQFAQTLPTIDENL